MAKILTTKGSAASLEDLIRRADSEIYLISFHFIISDAFALRIKQAAERGVIINIIYGSYIKVNNESAFKSIPNIKLFSYKNLHAKIFLNESKCIVGSMNFSEASEINNMELGVLLSKDNDPEAFKDVVSHCKDIMAEAVLERPMMPKEIADKFNNGISNRELPIVQASNWPVPKTKVKNKSSEGHCIRCNDIIKLNPLKPLCMKCHTKWNGDIDSKENYCHVCGERDNEDHITFEISQCRSCYKWWLNFKHPRHKGNN